MTPHQTPPSVTDEMVEAAIFALIAKMQEQDGEPKLTPSVYEKHKRENPLRHGQTVEMMQAALTAALAAMPGGGDGAPWRKLSDDDYPAFGRWHAFWRPGWQKPIIMIFTEEGDEMHDFEEGDEPTHFCELAGIDDDLLFAPAPPTAQEGK